MNQRNSSAPLRSAARRGWLVPGLACFAAGLGVGALGIAPTLAGQNAGGPPPSPTDLPHIQQRERGLDANLYLQTSAEYRACCLQTYALATERLRQKLAVLPNEGDDRRPAVVMDLDETVFDNAPFQTWMSDHAQGYAPALWSDWEKNHVEEVGLVPGAKGFIEAAERQGVAVIYLSGRTAQNRASTIAALKRLGLSVDGIEDVPEGRLLLQDGPASDKTARRERVTKTNRVLLYVGDNLRDLSEEFVLPKTETAEAARTAIAERARQVDRSAYRFGSDWFLLPNPAYGEWQKPFGDPASARFFLRRPATPLGSAQPAK